MAWFARQWGIVVPHESLKLRLGLIFALLIALTFLGALVPLVHGAAPLPSAATSELNRYRRIQQTLAAAYTSGGAAEWYRRTPVGGLVAEDDFTTAIVAAGQRGDVDEMVRLALQATVLCPIDLNFSARLSRVVECLQLAERVRGQALPDEVTGPIFTAAAVLPHDHVASQMGQIVHAAHAGYESDFGTQRRLTEALLADPALMDQVRPALYAALGSALENLGEPNTAAATYTRLTRLDSPDQYSRYLVRAVFLDLHTGNFAGADALLDQLQHLSASALMLTEGGEQILSLLRLRREGHAREYWKRTTEWWPQWQAIVARAHLPAEGVETTTPLLGGETALAFPPHSTLAPGSVGLLLQQMRRYVSAARWSPDAAAAVAAFADDVARIAPALSAQYDRFAVSVLQHAQGRFAGTENDRERQLQLAKLYLAIGQYDAVTPIVTALRSDHDVSPEFRGRVDQVWVATALVARRDIGTAAKALRADLRDDVDFGDRPAVVALTADALIAADDRAAAAEVLERELAHPAVRRDQAGWARLATDLEVLRARDGEAVPAAPTGTTVAGVDVPARLLRRVAAVYPDVLQRAQIRGTVVVEVVVDPTGSVISAHVASSPNPTLSDLAVAAVAKWQFAPATRDGRPVEARMRIPVSFGPGDATLTAAR